MLLTNGLTLQNMTVSYYGANDYIASLGPQIWLKFDDAFDSGSIWNAGAWINSGSESVNPQIVGGNVSGVAGLVPKSTYAAVNVGGSTTATFAAQYTPNANTTYFNQTITVNMTFRTNSDFRSLTIGNFLWHQGATAIGNGQGLQVNYIPNANSSLDSIQIAYLTPSTGWVQPNITQPPNIIMQNNTLYNFTFVYSPTGGSGFGYVKAYINGIIQGTYNLTVAVPNTAYAGRFGARGLNDSSLEYAARITMDNCLLFNRELTANEIALLSTYSLNSGCDPYYNNVVLSLPMNGPNASTTFTDFSSSPKTITVNGNAQISTAQSKWNGSSGYFDGSGDYISAPVSSDFQFGTGDFTIEGWIKSTTSGLMNGPFGQFPAGVVTGKWDLKTRFSGANNFVFTYYTGSAYVDTAASPAVNLNDDVWHHVAVVRSGTNIYMFSDGVLRRSTTISGSQSIGVSTHTFNVGYNPEDNAYYTGYANDVRITKGIARYTSNFVPPLGSSPIVSC